MCGGPKLRAYQQQVKQQKVRARPIRTHSGAGIAASNKQSPRQRCAPKSEPTRNHGLYCSFTQHRQRLKNKQLSTTTLLDARTARPSSHGRIASLEPAERKKNGKWTNVMPSKRANKGIIEISGANDRCKRGPPENCGREVLEKRKHDVTRDLCAVQTPDKSRSMLGPSIDTSST